MRVGDVFFLGNYAEKNRTSASTMLYTTLTHQETSRGNTTCAVTASQYLFLYWHRNNPVYHFVPRRCSGTQIIVRATGC